MEEFDSITQNQNIRIKKCPQCGSRSDSIYQKEASYITYLASFASLYVFQFWSLATQQVAKRCYDCDAVIEKHRLFSLPSLSDQRVALFEQILNFRFGSVAFIVSRKYAYIILSLFTFGFTYFTLTSNQKEASVQNNSPLTNINLDKTWIDFVKDCGSFIYLDNSVRAYSHFNKIYHANKVNWEGVFMECIQCPKDFNQMRVGQEYDLGIKMSPTDSASIDLVLRVGYYGTAEFLSTISNLHKFNIVKFTGQFDQLGGEQYPHILKLKSIKLTGKSIQNIEEIPQIEN